MIRFMAHLSAGVCALALTAFSAQAQNADTILRNGKIYTVDKDFRTAQAVAIRDGRISAVGDDATVMKEAGPTTQVIDLAGRTVIPGLTDTHLHQSFAATNLPAVQLIEARSVADVQKRIAERAAQTPAGQWIVASSGWHESLLAEGRLPTRYELDKAAPDNPVIIPRGGHVVTVNSKALELAGITKETKNPAGGVIVRDPASGEATGVLLESAAYFARKMQPPPPPPERFLELLKAQMQQLNALGIVGVVEPGIDERIAGLYQRMRQSGDMTVRTDLLYRATSLEQVQKGLAMREMKNDDMLRFVGFKFLLDGGVEGARLREPYQIVPGEQPDKDYRGLLLLPPGGEDEWAKALQLIAEAGLQTQTHAVGDETIDVVVRNYEKVNASMSIRDLRWTVMHIFLPSDAALKTMSNLGIMATVQDHAVLLGHNQRRWWGDARAAYAIPIRKILDAKIMTGGGSDGPVVPFDPFQSMWWMTTRQTLNGYALGPEQAITPREALTLYTINNAIVMGVEKDRGSIETGKLADIVVLSKDILTIPPAEIRDAKALMTLLGGKVVHRKDI
ncbi:MAG: amidohydrolase [Rhizobiales bacterium]|nr:amidohydrolase [Hyphomicrobiales bacterium]